MKRLLRIAIILALLSLMGAVPALAQLGDTAVTDQTYIRHDGGSDPTINACDDDSNTLTAGGNRQNNEPTVAINPSNTDVIVAGSNDYCTVPSTTDA